MGKKKKSSTAATAAERLAQPNESANTNPSSTIVAAAVAPSPPVAQPWASNYDGMKIVPIAPDPNLFLATDPLSEKVNQQNAVSADANGSSRRFQFGIFDSRADSIGRRCIALQPIKAGTLILSERGQPWVIFGEHTTKVCHSCAKSLYDPHIIEKKTTPDGQKAPSRHLHCSECDAVVYCSPECQSRHREVHELECPALQQVEEISDVAKVQVDLIRAAIKYVVNTGLEKKKAATSESSSSSSTTAATADIYDPYQFQSTLADCELLMDHLSAVNPTDLKNMKDAAALILKSLAPELQIPIERIVSFFGRINSNSHALQLEEHATIQFGFGLYPLCAIFNHSCYPSCVYINEGANLTFRVIRDVEKDEELTVNYISLYASRPIRRKELWESKKFFCQCRRCNLKPKNEEERTKFAQDALLGAIKCQSSAAGATGTATSSKSTSSSSAAAACPGYYRINYQMLDPKAEAERKRKRREEKEKKKALAAATAPTTSSSTAAPTLEDATSQLTLADDSKSASTDVNGAPSAGSDSDDDDEEDDESDFPLSLRPKVTSCRCNVCHHNGNKAVLATLQQTAFDKSEELLALYASGTKTPQMIKDQFEAFLATQANILHPSHAVQFNLLLPLVNVASGLREWKLKLACCVQVIQLAEQVFPKYFLPLCNYYEATSNTYKALIKHGLAENTPKKLLQRWKDDQIAILSKYAEAMAICRGPDHILTQAAQRDVAEAKKMKLSV